MRRESSQNCWFCFRFRTILPPVVMARRSQKKTATSKPSMSRVSYGRLARRPTGRGRVWWSLLKVSCPFPVRNDRLNNLLEQNSATMCQNPSYRGRNVMMGLVGRSKLQQDAGRRFMHFQPHVGRLVGFCLSSINAERNGWSQQNQSNNWFIRFNPAA